jgi:cobalt/nickel transport system permease protein
MTLALEHLAGTESRLTRFDPRWKLAALIPAAFLMAPLRTLPVAFTGLALAVLLVVLSGLPLRWYLRRLGNLGLFLLVCLLLLPFALDGPGPTWRLGPLQFSWHGLIVAMVLLCKALTIVSLMLVALATAPLSTTLKAAHALWIPGLLVQLLMLTYRYTYLLAEELGRIRIALRVRGYRNRANLHCYRTVAHVGGMLLVRGHERAQRVGQAMRCRGFDGQFHSLDKFHPRWTDVIVFFTILACACLLLTWDIASR